MSEHNHVVDKAGSLDAGQIDQALDKMDPEIKEDVLRNFETFKAYLAIRIELAEQIGLDKEQLVVVAEKVAGYLANNEEPRNREEKLLQELWKVGNKEEQHYLSHLLVKLAQSNH